MGQRSSLTNACMYDWGELWCELLPNQGRESVWGQSLDDWESLKFQLCILSISGVRFVTGSSSCD